MSSESILISGAREHNLKGVTVRIPRHRLTVVTGLSGSGKSSLAFDTLYAEGQRRYVESLSVYARQFLDQLQKPDVDFIEGLSPAIAIEQRTAGSNPRSIVATTTEIHDYLRLLFAHVGTPHCPKCGRLIGSQSAEAIVERLLQFTSRTRLVLLAPMVKGRKGGHQETFKAIRRLGFVRARVDGDVLELDDIPALDKRRNHTVEAVVDRLIVTDRIRTRLTDSVEIALKEGQGTMIVLAESDGNWEELFFSERYACPDCSLTFAELTPRCFSFNSPYGACPTCSGLGNMQVFDEDLIVPDRTVPLLDGAIQAWRAGGRRLIIHYKRVLRAIAKHYEFEELTAYGDLPPKIREVIMHGSGEEEIEFGRWRGGSFKKSRKPFEGVIPNLQRRLETTESDYMRQKLRRYMNSQLCSSCHGARLKPEVLACTLEERSIVDICRLSIKEARRFFDGLSLTETQQHIARDVLKEIRQRLRFLAEVGLEYLTLDRESGTLSGGEMQRIRLATQIGAGLVGVLYVLDEPTIGLHARDNQRLIRMLRELQSVGNTVVVVEHDEQMIREADHVIDLGPGAGRHGGEVIHEGSVEELLANHHSLTARYLTGEAAVALESARVRPTSRSLRIRGARANNLKKIDVSIPLGLLVCVTGVSGSGKSTLVDDTLRRALFRHFHGSRERPGAHDEIEGMEHLDKVIVIDQAPIGRTPRSNPATYTGALTGIRKLFAELPSSKVRGYGQGRYSFNVKGGRCEHCKGDGIIRLEMHFLPDVYVVCEQCNGKRFNRETLEVVFEGKTIADVLEMTVDEALGFFRNIPSVAGKLKTLSEVGLGYLHLGQPATTLSGGEAQRIKLAAELSKRSTGSTLYLLDEPTTGLHFADTRRLLQVLARLREAGNSVVIIEHNLDVIRSCDYIIDLGPEGGDGGGDLVAAGTPEQVAACDRSHTGQFLKEILERKGMAENA